MQRLGFDIAEVKDVILLLSSKSKNYKSYHPPASLRVIAAEKGYEKVKIQADAYAIDKVSNDFYYSGLNNFKLDKYGESIDDLNTYIKIEKRNERIDSLKLAESLGVVVVSKSLLEDSSNLNALINDGINYNPKDIKLHLIRGFEKKKQKL